MFDFRQKANRHGYGIKATVVDSSLSNGIVKSPHRKLKESSIVIRVLGESIDTRNTAIQSHIPYSNRHDDATGILWTNTSLQ